MDPTTSPSSSSDAPAVPRGRVVVVKGAFAVAGLLVGLVGMSRNLPVLVWAAVGCLGVAFALRFVGRR